MKAGVIKAVPSTEQLEIKACDKPSLWRGGSHVDPQVGSQRAGQGESHQELKSRGGSPICRKKRGVQGQRQGLHSCAQTLTSEEDASPHIAEDGLETQKPGLGWSCHVRSRALSPLGWL